jgi:hypothetical protein
VFFESLPLDLFIRYPFARRPAGFGLASNAMLALEESSAQRLYAAARRQNHPGLPHCGAGPIYDTGSGPAITRSAYSKPIEA